MRDAEAAAELRPDDAGQHERPRPGHPADAPAGLRPARPDAPSSCATLLAAHFQVETVGTGEQGARDTWELIEADGSQELLGFGTVADGVWQTARFRSPPLMAELAAEHSPAWRGLAVSVLHVLVLDNCCREARAASRSAGTSICCAK